jgi:hypothetical protein
MALDKFRAAPLPNPPAQWDPQYMRQVIRVLEIYFSQLDSNTPNYAQKYTADEFVGGTLSATSINATSVTTTSLTALGGQIDNLTTDIINTSYIGTGALQADSAEIATLMVDSVYGGNFYGSGRYLSTPYNQFQSQVDQTAASVADANALELEITDFADGIFIAGANDTEITFSAAGVYKLTYSLSFKNTTNDGQSIDVWFRYNDGTGAVDVADSNRRFFVPPRKSIGDPAHLVATTAYTGVATVDNAYVEIMWRVSDVAVTLEHLPAVAASPGVTPAIPATASAIVQADFVSAEYPPVTRVAPLPVFGFGQVGNISVRTT